MILTEIGEIGVTSEGQTYKLRPSLYAMTQIGSPRRIVEVYASVMCEKWHKDQFPDALTVLFACCEEDISDIFGAFVISPEGKLEYCPGKAKRSDVVPLARCLLKHGVTGALPKVVGKQDEYVQEFDARAHVSLVIAHLGLSSSEAWKMTMTEIVGAMRAKFPEINSSGSGAPTVSEHDATMEWFERVSKLRS